MKFLTTLFFLSVFLIGARAHSNPYLTFYPAVAPYNDHQIGYAGPNHDNGWAADVSQSQGYLTFGPYTNQVASGQNVALFTLQIDNNSADNGDVLTLDVMSYDGQNMATLGSLEVYRRDFAAPMTPQVFAVPFYNSGLANIQFRVYWRGIAYVEHLRTDVSTNPYLIFYPGVAPYNDHLTGYPGPNNDNGWAADVSQNQGYLTYGPYTNQVASGQNVAQFTLLIDNNSADNGDVLTLDVTSWDGQNLTTLGRLEVFRKDFAAPMTPQVFSVPFFNPGLSNIQFRVLWHGIAYIEHRMTQVATGSYLTFYPGLAPYNDHQTGSPGPNDDNGWAVGVVQNQGYMTYGPYTNQVPIGQNVAQFTLQIDNNSSDDGDVLTLDVTSWDGQNMTTLGSLEVYRKDFAAAMTPQVFSVPFYNPSTQAIQFRVLWHGIAYVEHLKTQVAPASQFGTLTLAGGQFVMVDGDQFTYQNDGNLVLYNSVGTPLWNSGTSGRSCSSSCQMVFQSDGNLVLYQNGSAYWQSGTAFGEIGQVVSTLSISPVPPYVQILGAQNNTLWKSSSPMTFANFTGEVFPIDPGLNQQIGTGWARLDFAWPNIETARGVYDWSSTDNQVMNALANGQQVLIDMAYTPAWDFNPSCNSNQGIYQSCSYFAPANLSDWTDFVTAVVARYTAPPFNARYFQIWNEPTPLAGFWNVTDGGDPDHEFVDQIYNPAAQIIRAYGASVVFGGWPGSNSIDELSNNVLSYNNAWQNTDYIDIHYNPLSSWQSLYTTWVATGKIKGLWQSEVGGATFFPGYLTAFYLQSFYWALLPASQGGGGWSSGNPNAFKLFWYAGWIANSNTCTVGTTSVCLTQTLPGQTEPILTGVGQNQAVLTSLFKGGDIGVFNNYTSNLPNYSLTTQPAAGVSGTLGFTVDNNRLVIAVFPPSSGASMNVTVPLSSLPRLVTMTDSSGNQQSPSVTYQNGSLTVNATSGGDSAYLLSINL